MVLIDQLKRRKNSKKTEKKEKKSEKTAKKLAKLVKSKSNNELTSSGNDSRQGGRTGDRKSRAQSMAFVICDSDQEEDVVIVHSLDNSLDASYSSNGEFVVNILGR